MKALRRTQKLALFSFLLLFLLAGCAGMNTSQRRVFTGAAVGAGGGALLGEVTSGNPAAGALVGGAAGALGGYLYDQSNNDRRYHYRNNYRYNNGYRHDRHNDGNRYYRGDDRYRY